MDAERLFNEQYAAMVSALRDDCHIVRIIAIRVRTMKDCSVHGEMAVCNEFLLLGSL